MPEQAQSVALTASGWMVSIPGEALRNVCSCQVHTFHAPTSPPVCPADGPSNAHLLIVFLGSTEITLHFGMDSKRLLASFFLKYIKDSFMLLLRCFFVCFTFVLNLATIFGSSFSSLWVLFYSWRN